MKMIMIEATAEELSANKRIADAIVDAFTNMCDSIVRIPWSNLPTEDEEEEGEDDAKEPKGDD